MDNRTEFAHKLLRMLMTKMPFTFDSAPSREFTDGDSEDFRGSRADWEIRRFSLSRCYMQPRLDYG